MKKIYLDVSGRIHSLYRLLLENPPDGYEVVVGGTVLDGFSEKAARTDFIFNAVTQGLSSILPVNLLKAQLERTKRIPPGVALTFANGHLVFRREPWVVDLEFVTQFAGYDYAYFTRHKRLIEKTLSRDDCRAIFSWTRAGTRGILENLDAAAFAHKVHETPLAVLPKVDFVRDAETDRPFTILFVGSINIAGQFAIKGGREVIGAFKELYRDYPNARLIVRSDLDPNLKSELSRHPGVAVIDGVLSRAELTSLFAKSDVLWFPGYHTPGLVILDAMSFELPVIATDVWATSEMVDHERTGLVIPQSTRLSYDGVNIPAWGARKFAGSLRSADPTVVANLVGATIRLIEDSGERHRMGLAGRAEVEIGKYSLAHRNSVLKSVFDDAIGVIQ